MRTKTRYAPLTRRHRTIMLSGVAVVLAWAFALAALRFRAIAWWLANCQGTEKDCAPAMAFIDYWWLVLLVGVLLIALVVHHLTRDRLRPFVD
jgi:hypothetical protein